MIRFYSLLGLMVGFECGVGGASRTPVVLRTQGDPTTEAHHSASGRPPSQTGPPRKRPFPRPPVKKRRV